MKSKPTNHSTLSNKLTLIYCLNAFDILFTFILLKTGLFYEANYLMQHIVENVSLSILVKLILPACLIIYILLKLSELPKESIKFCNLAINIVLAVYLFVNVLHLAYSSMYLLQI